MISWLATDFFAQSPVLALPVVALFLFMGVFMGTAIRTWRMQDEVLLDIANQPLGDDTGVPESLQSQPSSEADHG